MNIFRSLIGKVWQDPNAAEVVKISEGKLFLVRSGTVRSDRECIYNDAMATIRRISNVEHNFQLVVTRVYEEGDQELLEDEDETDEERVFLISEELEFRTGETEGEPTFIWRDLEGDVDEFYEFVASGTNAPMRAFFETCMYRAMFERKFKKSADNTTDSELQEFIWRPPSPTSRRSNDTTATSKVRPVSPTATKEASTHSTTSRPPASPPPARTPPTLVDLPPAIYSAPAELYQWDKERSCFVKVGDILARLVQPPQAGQFDYWLMATGQHGQVLAHRITSDMNHRWAHKVQSLTWNNESPTGEQTSWCFRFQHSEDMEQFRQEFTKALWESLHQYSWEKAKTDEQAYIISANEDVEMQDVEEEEEEEEEAVAEELDKSDNEEEPSEDPDNLPPQVTRGERNSQLAVGYKGDRSYVVRGSNIGVFSHTGDDVKYYSTIAKLAGPKGKPFKPKNAMLHDQDTKMILMDPTERNSLFSLDIERGKIVEEWKIHDDITVDHISPDNKFAQMTPEQTLVGVSHNALFRIDPRISGTKMVDSQYKQYVTKNQFSSVATTASGKLTVASEKGDIRLFDSIGKNAKTALPPLGDPIVGVDVTANGRWIVATTKTYLLLIDTLIGEGRYAGSLGFDRSFPANAKPIPRRLQLRAEHVAYMNHTVSFTPARFNMGEGQDENAIVTSTGQFVVAWDFAKVKKGQLDRYEIKKYEDFVVQDNFKFGDDKNIIVALQNNVLAVNKKNLRKPTRASLATPARDLHSRSSIVNSPY